MSTLAFTDYLHGPSGEFHTVASSNGYRHREEVTPTGDRPLARDSREFRIIFWIGVLATAVCALALLAYTLKAREMDRAWASLLGWTGIAGAVSALTMAGALLASRPLWRRQARQDIALRQIRTEVAQVSSELGAIGGQFARLQGEFRSVREDVATRVEAHGRTVAELVEQRPPGSSSGAVGDAELLRGLVTWAAHIDRRLALVQRCVQPADAPVAAQANGNGGEGSPLELSDDALRGYFMGFYDRERNPDDSPPAA